MIDGGDVTPTCVLGQDQFCAHEPVLRPQHRPSEFAPRDRLEVILDRRRERGRVNFVDDMDRRQSDRAGGESAHDVTKLKRPLHADGVDEELFVDRLLVRQFVVLHEPQLAQGLGHEAGLRHCLRHRNHPGIAPTRARGPNEIGELTRPQAQQVFENREGLDTSGLLRLSPARRPMAERRHTDRSAVGAQLM